MSTHDHRDDWEQWLKTQLQEVEVLPRKEYMEESLQQLLTTLQEERKKVRMQRRVRRTLEGAAVAVAAVALVYMAPHLNGFWNQDGRMAQENEMMSEAQPFGDMDEGPMLGMQADQGLENQMVASNNVFEVQIPALPLPVDETLVVSGRVNAEMVGEVNGNLRFEVEDGHNVLASGDVPTETTEGAWQPFVLSEELKTPTNASGTLILYVDREGQRLHELTIPLTFMALGGTGAVLPPSEEAYPAQMVELADERNTEPAFAAYFQQLEEAVARRDVEKLKSLMSPDIHLSFGGQQGYEALEEIWALKDDPQSSPIWSELEKALKYGAMRTGEYFRAPAVRLPEGADEYRARAIVGRNVNVRSAPSTDGEVIQQVTNLLARMPAEATRYDRPGWKAVILPSGLPGFVSEEYVYEPLGYRAVFGKVNGQWTMISWVSGD